MHVFCITAQIMEAKLLDDYFDKLAAILDVQNLSARFITARIITADDDEEISHLTRSQDKAKKVLMKIKKSLEFRTNDFHAMLDAMINHGNGANAALASEIKSKLSRIEGGMLLSIIAS